MDAGGKLRSKLSLTANRGTTAQTQCSPALPAAAQPLADITPQGNSASPAQPPAKPTAAPGYEGPASRVEPHPAAAAPLVRPAAVPAPPALHTAAVGDAAAAPAAAAFSPAAAVLAQPPSGDLLLAAGIEGDDEDDLPCFDILGDEEDDASAVAPPSGAQAAQAGSAAAAVEPATHHPPAPTQQEPAWGDGRTTAAGAAAAPPWGELPAGAAAFATPGTHLPIAGAAAPAGGSAGQADARATAGSGGGTSGKRARVSSRRQKRCKPLFEDDMAGGSGSLELAEPGPTAAAASSLDDADLFDVPWRSSKKQAAQQQGHAQAAAADAQPASSRRLPSTFSVRMVGGGSSAGGMSSGGGGSHGSGRKGAQLGPQLAMPQDAAEQLVRAGLVLPCVDAAAPPSMSKQQQQGCASPAERVALGGPSGVAHGAGAAAGQLASAQPAQALPVPDSEDEEGDLLFGPLEAPPPSARRASLQRLRRADGTPAPLAGDHVKRQGQASHAAGAAVAQPGEPEREPRSAARSVLQLAPTEPPRPSLSAPAARPKNNPFARAAAKPSRVVLATGVSGAKPAVAGSDTAAMMQSVLDSLPPPPSPPAPSAYSWEQADEEPPQQELDAWERGWEDQEAAAVPPYYPPQQQQQQQTSYPVEQRAWQSGGGDHQQQQQQQEPATAAQGQVLSWAEQSEQYRLQGQGGGGSYWQQPAWFNQGGTQVQQVPEAEPGPRLQQQQQQQQHGFAADGGWRQRQRQPEPAWEPQQQQRQQQQDWRADQAHTGAWPGPDSGDDFDQPGPSSWGRTQPQPQQPRQPPNPAPSMTRQQQQQQGGRGEVINLVGSSPPQSLPPGPRAAMGGWSGGGAAAAAAGCDTGNAAGQPWWYRLPDLVPVEVLAKGKNPRDGSVVYIDYARQFTGATGGGGTTAARQAVRQLQKAGADLAGGRAASSRGGGAKPRKRQGQSGAAAAGDGAVGHWVVEPGQAKAYINARGEKFYGQRGYLEYCKEKGMDPRTKRKRAGGGGSGGGGRRRRKGGGKRARKK